ncbi:MAG TPA: alpha/beta hydrolase [Solirubrobacteraceae bacterium]|jgi:pimeloyl-ACP methyl ester carboxylesterase|nr:alpha/beta hydrolase [Solirubrobacteraceae bacterium]
MVLPYDESGDGPAIVLLHAGICDRRMYARHREPLAAEGVRAIAVDLPGFGDARLPDEEDAPWLDVLATLDELAVSRAVLVGNSFGGAVAQRAAVVAPERVAALVLVSSPAEGIEPSAQLAAAWDAEATALERGDIDAAVAAVLEAWTLPGSPEEIRELVGEMQRRAFVTQLAGPEPQEASDPLADDAGALAVVDAPALVAVGEHDMPDFHRAADELVRALPNARREVIAGAGHLAPLEQPEAFRELVLTAVAGAG